MEPMTVQGSEVDLTTSQTNKIKGEVHVAPLAASPTEGEELPPPSGWASREMSATSSQATTASSATATDTSLASSQDSKRRRDPHSRTARACDQCWKLHRRCHADSPDVTTCARCLRLGKHCTWDQYAERLPRSATQVPKPEPDADADADGQETPAPPRRKSRAARRASRSWEEGEGQEKPKGRPRSRGSKRRKTQGDEGGVGGNGRGAEDGERQDVVVDGAGYTFGTGLAMMAGDVVGDGTTCEVAAAADANSVFDAGAVVPETSLGPWDCYDPFAPFAACSSPTPPRTSDSHCYPFTDGGFPPLLPTSHPAYDETDPWMSTFIQPPLPFDLATPPSTFDQFPHPPPPYVEACTALAEKHAWDI
ncbi:hypothetical protein ACQY0O_005069 [Thecaphora frezii]